MIRKLALVTTLVILLAINVEASELSETHVKDTIVKHSVEMGVDPSLALSIAKAESGYSHQTRSKYGAIGVYQLMPATAKKLGVNPYHLNDNIRGGLMYYKMLYKMFGSTELALAAYHTGPAYVLKNKRPAPCSKPYISVVMSEYYRLKAHTDPAIKRHNAKQAQINNSKKVKPETKKEAPLKSAQINKNDIKQAAPMDITVRTVLPIIEENATESTNVVIKTYSVEQVTL